MDGRTDGKALRVCFVSGLPLCLYLCNVLFCFVLSKNDWSSPTFADVHVLSLFPQVDFRQYIEDLHGIYDLYSVDDQGKSQASKKPTVKTIKKVKVPSPEPVVSAAEAATLGMELDLWDRLHKFGGLE